MHFKETGYGFEWGAASIERISSDNKTGWIVVQVKSDKGSVQVYVTRTGKIRVFSNDKELSPHTDKGEK